MSDLVSLQSVTTAELSTQIRTKLDEAYRAYRETLHSEEIHIREEAWNNYGRVEDVQIRLDKALKEAMAVLDSET